MLSVRLQVKNSVNHLLYCVVRIWQCCCWKCRHVPFFTTETNNFVGSSRNSKALQTFHRVDRLSRKLQRRLTQHTLAEVKAMKEYSKDALRFVLLTLELVRSSVEVRSRVQKFPAWHTKAAPNGKCCQGCIVPFMVRLMYQLKSVLK